jgi:hypothetical protein
MRKIALLLAFCLSGCGIQTKLANDVAADAAGASSLATDIGDASAIPCYSDINAVAAAIAKVNPPASAGASMTLGPIQMSAGTKKLSILTEIEVARAFKRIQQDPACAQIFLEVGNAIVKAGLSAAPGGGILGAILP